MYRIPRVAVSLFGILGSLASISGLLIVLRPPERDSGAALGMTYLASFAITFLLFGAAQEYRFSRKARNAEAATYFQEAFLLSFAASQKQFGDYESLRNSVQIICDQLASAFTLTTATKCSVCIKILDQWSETGSFGVRNLSVSTLARDSRAAKRSKRVDASDVAHWIDANTDFLEIYRTRGPHVFFENNLPALRDYRNTSFAVWSEPPGNWLLRRLNWPLPYKSTIVAALTPRENRAQGAGEELVGFLAVDSSSVSAFSKRYDKDWIETAAEMLHPVIRQAMELRHAEGKAERASAGESEHRS